MGRLAGASSGKDCEPSRGIHTSAKAELSQPLAQIDCSAWSGSKVVNCSRKIGLAEGDVLVHAILKTSPVRKRRRSSPEHVSVRRQPTCDEISSDRPFTRKAELSVSIRSDAGESSIVSSRAALARNANRSDSAASARLKMDSCSSAR